MKQCQIDEIFEPYLDHETKYLNFYHTQMSKSGKTKIIEVTTKDNYPVGTIKIYALACHIFESLEKGCTLVIDEFEARVHPLMSRVIVKLFNSKENNPNNAQLILTSHDTNLLRKQLFRRDQIWFLEKTEFGDSELFSLVDFKIRPESIYNKDYLQGKFGAIPVINDFSSLFEVIDD